MTTTAINTATAILRLNEPRRQVSLGFVAGLLSHLHTMEREAVDYQDAVQQGELRQRRIPPPPANPLVIRRIRGGSLLVEVVQGALAPGGALTVLIIAHVLSKGPENLHKWARLPKDLRTEWHESRKALRAAKLQRSRETPDGDPAISSKPIASGVTHSIDGGSYETRYVEEVNRRIEGVQDSRRSIQGLTHQLEVRVVDERGEDVRNPFDTDTKS